MASRLIYIGTYTETDAAPVLGGKGIFICRFSEETGALELVDITPGVTNPSFLALNPNRGALYAVSEIAHADMQSGGQVVAYAIDPNSGALSEINRQPSEGSHPCHISVEASGQMVLVANYSSGSVTTFPVQPGGGLGKRSCFVQHSGAGPNASRQEHAHAHMIMPDPNNRFVYVPDLGIDRVMIYQLDMTTKMLHAAASAYGTIRPGEGPRHLDFHPNGRFAYVINELGSSITAFTWDQATGALSEIKTVSTLPPDFTGNSTCADIHLHPSGRFVYGSNRGHDSIAIFAIQPDEGTLTPLGYCPSGGRTPRNFAVDPSGRWLLAANQDSNNIAVFAIDARHGALTPTDHILTLPAPVCIKFAG